MTVAGDPAGYELAFLEGRRAVDEQAGVLKETRDRVGTVVSAAAVVAGLATGLGFGSRSALHQLDASGIAAAAAAAVAFAAMILGAVMIWRPLPGVFTLDAGILIGSYVEGDPPATVAEMHRDLAVHLGRHAKRNADELQKRLGWFTFALVAFVVEIAALVALLVDVA